jgi:phage gp46-like protein
MANITIQGWSAGTGIPIQGWSGSPGIPPEKPISPSIINLGDDDIRMAMIISLFCDRRLKFGGIEPLTKDDRRGWWGDKTLIPGDYIGSRLWTLSRYKMVEDQTFPEAENMIKEALKWLIDDGVTDTIQILITRQDNETVLFNIGIKKPDEKDLTNYYFAWKLTDNSLTL